MSTAAIANRIFQQLSGGRISEETASYVAVPGDEEARWLLPAASSKIGTVLGEWAPCRLRSQVAWMGVRAANRVGCLREMPGVSIMEVAGPRGADWASLGWRWGSDPVPVVYLGTSGPRRKAVVLLVDQAWGRCRAVVKVPLTEGARAAIVHEAKILEALASERYEWAPRLLHVDGKRAITAQTFVEGRPVGRKLTPEVWQLLHTLAVTHETTSLKTHVERWAAELSDCAEQRTVVEMLDELRDDTLLPACWEHGDFTPWNIKRLAEGGYALLDWEEARRNGLPLQDAYHFLHVQDFLFGGRPQLHVAEVREKAIGLSVPPEKAGALESAYLIGALVQCIKRGNRERARFLHRTLELCRSKA